MEKSDEQCHAFGGLNLTPHKVGILPDKVTRTVVVEFLVVGLQPFGHLIVVECRLPILGADRFRESVATAFPVGNGRYTHICHLGDFCGIHNQAALH